MVNTGDTCMNQLPTETEASFIIPRSVSDMHIVWYRSIESVRKGTESERDGHAECLVQK